jgi:hypothetical protein
VRRAGCPPVNTLVLAIAPAGLHGIPDTTIFYATNVRDARSNCNERLVSNDIELSRVWGPCCGMSYLIVLQFPWFSMRRMHARGEAFVPAGANVFGGVVTP